jgi:segregation and condensation protein B
MGKAADRDGEAARQGRSGTSGDQPASDAAGKKKAKRARGAATAKRARTKQPKRAKGAIDLSKVAAGTARESTNEPAAPPADASVRDLPSAPPAPADAPTPARTADSPADGAEVPAAAPALEATPPLPPAERALLAAVEAIIFAADEPVTVAAIAKAIGNVKPGAVRKAIDQLRSAREEAGSGVTIEEIAGGWTMLTREEYAPAIRRLRKASEGRKLTGASLETLSVVAYKQPIQKQEIEDIRGVSCGPILRALMEQDLVKIAGRAEALGRPLLYGTTKRFLDVFGLASLKDLPKISEIAQS